MSNCLPVKPPLRLLAAAGGLCAAPLTVCAQIRSEWLFFPAVTAVHRTGLPQGDELAHNQIDPALDVLDGHFGSMSGLAEIYLSEHEQERTRLSVEWQFNSKNTLSVGKFHNLQGYALLIQAMRGGSRPARFDSETALVHALLADRFVVTYMWSDRDVAWANLRIVAELC